MYDVKAFEAGFGAPFSKVCARVIEGITELDQHVQ